MNRAEFQDLIGFARHQSSLREMLLSTLGGFAGIAGVLLVSYSLLDPETAVYIVPSMGASAVLLFAAPHAPLSQPWNLCAGHLISAGVGVACWQWIPNLTLAASAAVALATGLMYLTRSTHPPGGATALAAAIGSDRLHQLGFSYVLEPILLNVLTMLLIAVLFGIVFRWRRYPAYLYSRRKNRPGSDDVYAPIKHEDFVYALSQIDTLVDVSEEDLLEIYRLATSRRVHSRNSPS